MWRAAETIGVSLALPAFAWIIDHNDPLLLKSRFPWLVLVPLLVALRHGWKYGMASFLVLDIMLLLAWRTQFVPVDHFPAEAMVGIFAVAVITGKFTDTWSERVAKMHARTTDLEERTSELARSNFILELSHERLDEQLEHAGSSLRDAIAAVQARLKPTPDAVLEVFASYCGVDVAELLLVEDGRLGSRLASLGQPDPLPPDDPVVAQSLRSASLVYVTAAVMTENGGAASPVLAAVPFVSPTTRTVRAVLCVQAMPFMSFQRRNLEAMATIAAHFAALGDEARPEPEVPRERKRVPQQTLDRYTESAS